MNKLTTRSRNVPASALSSSIPENAGVPDGSQQDISKTAHHHRNNHNHDFIQDDDEILKSIDDITHRKRRSSVPYYHRTENKISSLPIYINNILLILIRLMILFLVVLFVSFTFYSTIIYFYSKPKKNAWERMIEWLFQE